MKDFFDDELPFNDGDMIEEYKFYKTVSGVCKVIKEDNELKVYDLDDEVSYRFFSDKDKEKLISFENKYLYLSGKVNLSYEIEIHTYFETNFTKKLNSHPELQLSYSFISMLSYTKEHECNRIIETMLDCIHHRQTSVSKLIYSSCSILTKWLLDLVEKNKKLGKEDIFEDVYLPSGNKMNEEVYQFFIEHDDYRKDHLKTLADFLLYVNNQRVIELKEDFDEVYDRYIQKYPRFKNEISQVLHYLYGLNRNRDNKFKNILLKGQNIEHTLNILYEIASDLDIPIFELSMSSLGDGGDLVGHNPTYTGAMMGRLVENYLKVNTTSAIVVLKRLDDLSRNTTSHSSVHAILSELLNHRILCENYLRYDFDIRTSFIVGTCLDENNLNADLASYFYTVVHDNKEIDDMKDVVRNELNHIVPDDWDNVIDEDVIDLIALKTYVDPFGDVYKKYCFLLVNYALNENLHHSVIDASYANRILNHFLVVDHSMEEFIQYYHDYDPEIRKKMSSYFIDLKKNNEDIQLKIKEKLNYLKYCHATIPKMIDLEQVKLVLNQTHCGLNHVKDALLNAFYQYNHTPASASHLMFYSPLCGIGKTSIAIDACKAAKLDIIRINCAQINDLSDLYGSSTTPGMLLSKIKELKTTTAPILLDEFEKCLPTIQNSLLNLTDTSNASFYSPYLETNIPIQCGLTIVTANDLSKVSDALKDRFKVLEFKPYDLNTKKQIIQNKIITSLQQQFSSNLSVNDDVISHYLDVHPFASIREIEMDFRQAYVHALRNNHVISFDEGVLNHSIVKNTTNILGVIGQFGCVNKLECLFDHESDQLMGNCKDLFQEEFKIVLKHMRHSRYLEDEKVFMNVYGNGFAKDGKSAGLALFASIYAFKNHLDISEFGFTGEVTLFGRVEAIGGLYFKLLAAKNAGLKKVVIPFDNYSEYVDMKNDLDGLEVYFVKDTNECIHILEDLYVDSGK